MRLPHFTRHFAFALCTLVSVNAVAGTTTLDVGQPLERAALLKPGVHRYLRYTVQDGKRSTKDIWSREVHYDTVDGQRQLRITQRWDAVGEKPYTHKQDSRFESGTMRPLTHTSESTRDGKTRIAGYRFLPGKVIGMNDLPDNAQQDFALATPEAPYNFETDIEFLQSLPLASGYTASIPFYDPGLSPPARYLFKVAGEDTMTGPDGRAIDCWVVTTDYNRPGHLARFWFAKGSQVMIRQESPMPDGGLLVKTLLPPEAADNGG